MTAKRSLTKAARMLLLRDLRRAGYLDHLSLRQIARRFGVNASTIHDDLQCLADIEPEIERLFAAWRAEPVTPPSSNEPSPLAWLSRPASGVAS